MVLTVLAAFTGMLPAQPSYAQESIFLPPPGQLINITRHFEPAQMVGLKINLKDPFSFGFIMDQGESRMSDADTKEEYNKIIKYFLVSLAMPNKDMWVNLSPYESKRIIPEVFGQTEMGRDLLAQDYTRCTSKPRLVLGLQILMSIPLIRFGSLPIRRIFTKKGIRLF